MFTAFKLKIIFLMLLNGSGFELVPFGEVTSETQFPSYESCNDAGRAIARNMTPELKAGLATRGLGALYGSVVDCPRVELKGDSL